MSGRLVVDESKSSTMRPSRCSSISQSPPRTGAAPQPSTVDRPDRLFEVLNMAQ